MEELRQTALAYYENLSEYQKNEVANFFRRMDTDGNGNVSFREFKASLPHELRQHAHTMFRELDKDRNDTLDFEEVITCYYMFVTRRVGFCDGCGCLLKGVYFTCCQCFYRPGNSDSFDLCCACFRRRNFAHHADAIFYDNFALLRSQTLIQSLQNQMTPIPAHYTYNQMTPVYPQSTYNPMSTVYAQSTSNQAFQLGNNALELGMNAFNIVQNIAQFFGDDGCSLM